MQHIIQITKSRMKLKISFLMLLIPSIISFQFREVVVSASVTTIRAISSYNFTLTRSTNNSALQTDWNKVSVPAGSNITIQFPSQYTNENIAQCSCSLITIDSVNFSDPNMVVAGTTVIIMDTITSASFIKSVKIYLSNIINPAPAAKTSSFIGTIGIDLAQPLNGAYVQLTSGSLISCSATFNKGLVSTYDNLTISLASFSAMATTNLVYVTFPTSYQSSYDTNSTIGVQSTMTCTSSQNNALYCIGNKPSTSTVTVYNPFISNSTYASFQIHSILVPPTIQTIDTITIATYTSGLVIYDRCSVSYSNLNYINLNSITYSTASTAFINKVMPLTFVIPLLTKVYALDYILISISASYTPIYELNSITGTTDFSINSNSATSLNFSTSTDLQSGKNLSIILSNIILPPSSGISPTFTISIYQALYLKAKGSFSIRVYPNTITSIATSATNPIIGGLSKYTINFIAVDPIPSTGMIRILIPTEITFNSSSLTKASINGQTITSTILSTFNGISFTNIPSISLNSNINLVVQTLQNPYTGNPITNNLTLLTYYSTSTVDLIDSVTYTPTELVYTGPQTINYLVYSTSDTVAATNVSLIFVVTTKVELASGGSIAILLYQMPFSVTNTSCQLSSIGQSISYPCFIDSSSSVNKVIISNITSNHGLSFNITVSNTFTNPPSTMPQAYFTIITYSQLGIQIQRTSSLSQSYLSLSTPSSFIFFNVSKSSYMNSDTSTYTFTFQQPSSFFTTNTDINQLLLTFPSQITISSASCSNCIVNSGARTILVTLVNAIISSTSQVTIAISNIKNAPSFQPPSQNISAITQYNTLYSYSRASYPNNFAETINSIPSGISLGSDTAYSVFAIGQSNSLKINIVSNNSFVYYYVFTLSSQFISNNISCSAPSYTCTYNSSYNNIIINKTTASTNLANVIVTISGFINPIISSDQSLSSSLRGYTSNNYQVNQYSGSLLNWSPNCNLPCQTCTSNKSICLSCFTNTSITSYIYYYAQLNQCLSVCYYTQIQVGYTCVDCTNNCMQCTATTDKCTACNTSSIYSYFFNFTCIKATDCPLYYYADSTYNCLSCSFPCSTCTNSTQCLSCATQAYWYENNCISTCPFDFTVPNSVNKTCDLCSQVCATCSVTVDNCTSCGSGTVRFNSTCLTNCSSPNYAYLDQCVSSCVSPCITCQVSATYCLSCQTSTTPKLYLFQGQCLKSCPSSYVINTTTNICDACSSLNLNCNCYHNQNCSIFGGTLSCIYEQYYTCIKCDPNYTYYYNGLIGVYQCVTSLPDGYVSINYVAYLCDSSCVTCVNFKTNCTYCSSLNLFNGVCVSSCLSGYYSNNITISFNSTNISTLICSICQGNCSSCLNQTQCLSCRSNSYYDGNYGCVASSSCPTYTYGNDTYGNCTSCSSPCLTCQTYSSCLSCVNSTYLYGSQCITTCPARYYNQNTNNTCTACSFPCLTCQGSATLCTHCAINHYYYSYNTSCLSDCPVGFTENYLLQICQNCTLPCIQCSQSICYKCTQVNSTLYYYFQQQCLSACPQGYYPTNDILNLTCLACDISCFKCTNSSYCISCSANYSILLPGVCVSQCPTYQPVRKTVMNISTCFNCSATNCALCSAKDECIRCTNYTFVLTLGICSSTCADGYQKIENITNNNASCQKIVPVYEPPFIQGSTLEIPIYFPCSCFAAFFCIISLFIHFFQFCCMSNQKILLFPLLSSALAIPQICATYLGAFTYFLLRYRVFLRGPLSWDIFIYLFAISIFIQILVGIYTLFIQTKIEKQDSVYLKWSRHSNFCQKLYQYIINLFTILNFKMSHCLWCGIKSLPMLESSNKLVFYNRPSGVSAIVSLIITTNSIVIIKFHPELAVIYYDIIIVIVLSLLLSLLALRRPNDFFIRSIEPNPHLPLNKRVAQSENYLIPVIKPEGVFDSNDIVYFPKSKSQLSSDSISDRNSSQYSFNPLSSQRSSLHLENISIQYSSPSISDKFTNRYEQQNSQDVRTLGTVSVYNNPGGLSTLQNIAFLTKLHHSNHNEEDIQSQISNLLDTNIARLEEGDEQSFTAQNQQSIIGKEVLPKQLRNNFFDVQRCHTLNQSQMKSQQFVYFSEHPSVQRSISASSQSPSHNTNPLHPQNISSYLKSQQILEEQIIDHQPVSFASVSISSNHQQANRTNINNKLSQSKSIIEEQSHSKSSGKINDASSCNNDASANASVRSSKVQQSILEKSVSRYVQVNKSITISQQKQQQSIVQKVKDISMLASVDQSQRQNYTRQRFISFENKGKQGKNNIRSSSINLTSLNNHGQQSLNYQQNQSLNKQLDQSIVAQNAQNSSKNRSLINKSGQKSINYHENNQLKRNLEQSIVAQNNSQISWRAEPIYQRSHYSKKSQSSCFVQLSQAEAQAPLNQLKLIIGKNQKAESFRGKPSESVKAQRYSQQPSQSRFSSYSIQPMRKHEVKLEQLSQENNLDVSVGSSIQNENGSFNSDISDNEQRFPNNQHVLSISSFHQQIPTINTNLHEQSSYRPIQHIQNFPHIQKRNEQDILLKINAKHHKESLFSNNANQSERNKQQSNSIMIENSPSSHQLSQSISMNCSLDSNHNQSIQQYDQEEQQNYQQNVLSKQKAPLKKLTKKRKKVKKDIPKDQQKVSKRLSLKQAYKRSQNASLFVQNQINQDQQSSNQQSHKSNIFNQSHLDNYLSANNSQNPSIISLTNSQLKNQSKVQYSNQSISQNQLIILEQAQSVQLSKSSNNQNSITLSIQEPLPSKHMEADNNQFRIRTKKKKKQQRRSKQKVIYAKDSEFKALKRQAVKLQKQIRVNTKLQMTIQNQMNNSLSNSKAAKLHYQKSGSKEKKKGESEIEKIYHRKPFNSREKDK